MDLDRLDARIAELEAELAMLRRERLAFAPPPAPPVPARAGLSGTSVVLTLAALLLVTAVGSFAGFVWPHLTVLLRAAVLAGITAALSATALSLRSRLPLAAEALAAVSAAATAVLAVWWYLATDVEPSPTGVAVALGAAGITTATAALAHRFRSWTLGSSVLVTISALLVSLDAHHVDAAAIVAAVLLALAAWRLQSHPLMWGTAATFLVALFALADRVGASLVPAALPLAVTIAALAAVRAMLAPTAHRQLRAAIAAVTTITASPALVWAPRALFADSPDARVDAALVFLAAAAALRTNRQWSAPAWLPGVLAALAVVLVTANQPVVLVVVAAVVLAAGLRLRPSVPLAVAPSVLLALTAPSLSQTDAPSGLVLAAAALVSAVSVPMLRTRAAAAPAGAAGVLAALSWLVLGPPGPLEVLALPAALLLATGWVLARWADPTLATVWLTPALVAALVPSALATAAGLDRTALVRTALVLVAATVALVLGVRHRLAGPVAAGTAVVLLVVALRAWELASALPLWAPLAAAGATLLLVGSRLEAARERSRRGATWLATLK